MRARVLELVQQAGGGRRYSMWWDFSSEIRRAFLVRSTSRSLMSEDSMLGKQVVHVVADAIAEVVADAANRIQAVN